ncbi:hypothetical protein D3C77_754120 [compost metagenome]
MGIEPRHVGGELHGFHALGARFIKAIVDHDCADATAAHVGPRLHRFNHHGFGAAPDKLGQDGRLESADDLAVQFRHVKRLGG